MPAAAEPPPSTLSPEAIARVDLNELVKHSSGPRGRAIRTLRTTLGVLLVLLVVALLASEPATWRIATFVVAAALVTAILFAERAWLRRRAPRVEHMGYYFAVPALVAHTAVVAITGGMESPFVVFFVVVGMVPAVVTPRVGSFLVLAGLSLGILWVFAIGAATGLLPYLTPTVLGGGHAYGNPAYAYTQAVAYSIATLLGGSGILAVRAALDRTSQTATAIRQELFDIMRERNRELLSLSSELAHELKNPLASIQGLSTLVERKLPAGTKDKERMSVLVGEVKRMASRLDEFLNFSRPVVSLSTRPVAPARLIAEVVQLHEGLAVHNGVTLSLRTSDVDQLACDPRKIKQVLHNLMHNALDATPPGGAIVAAVEPRPGGGARFVIADSGTGLAETVRTNPFAPGVTTKPDGSGLGLTIAHAIAVQHGGCLVLEDRPGGGCRAVLEIPEAAAELGAAGAPEGSARTSTGAAAAPAGEVAR